MPMKKSPSALRQTRPIVWGETWPEVEAELLASPADAEIVARLEQVLLSEGGFVDPVVIDPDELTVISGTHRVVAALRTDTAIDTSWTHPTPCADSELREVSFRIEIVDSALARCWSPEDDATEDLLELSAVSAALGSIPTDGGWLNAPVFATSDGTTHIATWFPSGGSTMPEDGRLTEILVRRARRAGLALTVLEISSEPEWLTEADGPRPGGQGG